MQQESGGTWALPLKLKKSDNIVCCEDLEGEFVSRNHIFWKDISSKLRIYVKAHTQEISQGNKSTHIVYPFAISEEPKEYYIFLTVIIK